jgi:heparan-alpha-glucosaminide N-acetyltransferase
MSTSPRILSIDIARAITMLLMIFVNDLYWVRDVPSWIGHTPVEADGMGLADTVFPAFLFMVGMSIPFAAQNWNAQGHSKSKQLGSILLRTLGLVTMGVFLLCGDNLNTEASPISRNLWFFLSVVAFILIWNRYPNQFSKWLSLTLQCLGLLLLLFLASQTKDASGALFSGFKTQWWGILGLIGWSYLVAALCYQDSGPDTNLDCAYSY